MRMARSFIGVLLAFRPTTTSSTRTNFAPTSFRLFHCTPSLRAMPSLFHEDLKDDDWTKQAANSLPSRTLFSPSHLSSPSSSPELHTCSQGAQETTIPTTDPARDNDPLRILILYGSLRKVSYSKFLAMEFARLLTSLGAQVHVFDPASLPLKDESSTSHPSVQDLRAAAIWSEGMVWVSPEQHGSMTAVFKNQIDWIPLTLGSVRPTQGRTLALAQVNGGSQSFNALNQLRILGRWMRCFTIPNQSSIPKAWTQFDSEGRLKDTGFRERVIDVAEELWKMTYLLRSHRGLLDDRYSERKEKAEKGRLQSQAEQEEERIRKEKEQEEARNTGRVTGQGVKETNEPEVCEGLDQEAQEGKRRMIETTTNNK